ncbi:MAG: hypothetical protein KBB71_12125 [Lentimicrobiaceae bacterium]|nr:hypothetical protein [Lentimicrobiaceae bacterium]
METGLYDISAPDVDIPSTNGQIDYKALYQELREGYYLAELGECPYSECGAFIDLIIRCTHVDIRLPRNDTWVKVDRGTTLTSIRELAAEWRWPRMKVFNFLQELQDEGIILMESTRQGTLITLT